LSLRRVEAKVNQSDFMEYKELGRTGEKIPVLGLGTWEMSLEKNNAVKAIEFAIKEGMNLIDTAEIYDTEDIVGEAIQSFKRDDVFIATKVSPNHFRYNDVIRACDASLKRLGIKQIDLYQLHWPNPKIPIEETMKAMEKLVEEGKIRYIGVSNFSVQEMIEAQEALSKNEIVSNQVEYSLLVRYVEKEGILDFCKKEKITLIAYRPLVKGKIFTLPENSEIFKILKKLSEKYNKTISQIALNWLISKQRVVAIPKSVNIEHIKENLGAIGWKMDKDDIKILEQISEKYQFKPLIYQ
jgi:hypothetical protein